MRCADEIITLRRSVWNAWRTRASFDIIYIIIGENTSVYWIVFMHSNSVLTIYPKKLASV